MNLPAATSPGLFDPTDLSSGKKLVDGASLATLLQWSFTSSYGNTALAGGGAGGPIANANIYEVDTVVTAADSISLPFGVAGLTIRIFNQAATNALAVFPQAAVNPATGVADTMLAVGGGTVASQSIVAKASFSYFCIKPGIWKSSN